MEKKKTKGEVTPKNTEKGTKTVKELIELYHALNSAVKKGNVKFKLACFRNLRLFESQINDLKKVETEISDLIKPYQQEYSAIINKYGTDELIQIDDKTVSQKMIKRDNENFDKASTELKTLETKYKDKIELNKSRQEEYAKEIEEPIDFVFVPIDVPVHVLPDDLSDVELKQMLDFGIVK